MSTFRALTSWEKRLLLRLLSSPFPGRDTLIAQVKEAVASPMHEDGTPLDQNGSLYLNTSVPESASVIARVPAEGEARDIDGVLIHYLLHVDRGRIFMLETFREDGARVLRQAEPEDVTVTSPPYLDPD